METSKLHIHTYPAAVLLERSDPVDQVNDQVVKLAQEMSQLMIVARGIGLAAPQVGVARRIITANVGDGFICVVNPVILEQRGQARLEEGCLSCPGVSVDVDRSEKIVLRGLNLEGKELTIKAEGLKARVLQHEIDHLDGVLILNKLPWLERIMAQRKLRSR